MPDLTNAHSIDVICRTAQILPPRDILINAYGKYLLYQGVRVSFAEGAESEAAEDETAINDANAIKGAIQGYSRVYMIQSLVLTWPGWRGVCKAIANTMGGDGEYQASGSKNLEEVMVSSEAHTPVVTPRNNDETGSNIDCVNVVEDEYSVSNFDSAHCLLLKCLLVQQ